jgi:hypothetical protein
MTGTKVVLLTQYVRSKICGAALNFSFYYIIILLSYFTQHKNRVCCFFEKPQEYMYLVIPTTFQGEVNVAKGSSHHDIKINEIAQPIATCLSADLKRRTTILSFYAVNNKK